MRAFWPFYLWDEALGEISERRDLVNITDGAHTNDNIGLYPLFQRGCKYIIAGDAGEDPKGNCQSLFSVITQVGIDFNITVDINVDSLKPRSYDAEKKEAEPSLGHFAIGKITYPATMTESKKVEEGWLIYFRPSVTDQDPGFIKKYWERHKLDFPHQTTADQFFDDEQFEAYRMLGENTVENVLEQVTQLAGNKIKDAKSKKRTTNKARKEFTELNQASKFISGFRDESRYELFKPTRIRRLLELYFDASKSPAPT